MIVLEADSADDLWLSLVSEFQSGMRCREQMSRSGLTFELLEPSCLVLRKPWNRWVATRSPAMNFPFALAEVIWILCGSDDAKFLNFFNGGLPRYAGFDDEYYGAYGARLRSRFGFDQIERAITALQGKSESRQVVLQIWDPRSDFPNVDGTPRAPDIPCNITSMLKIRDGKLQWTQVMRSNDFYLGLPYNLVQFTALQEFVAHRLGVEVGPYTHISDSTHIYESDLNKLERSTKSHHRITGYPLFHGQLLSDDILRTLFKFILKIQALDHSFLLQEANKFLQSLLKESEYVAHDIACVLISEVVRKRVGSGSLLNRDQIENRSLIHIWDRWLDRVKK